MPSAIQFVSFCSEHFFEEINNFSAISGAWGHTVEVITVIRCDPEINKLPHGVVLPPAD